MTTFIDGPAKGQHLMLRRKVRFLRVVVDSRSGNWDALDMLADHAEPTDTIYAYEAQGNGGMCHINRGKNGSGFFSIQDYKFIPDQPSDEDMRDNDRWSKWVNDRAERLGLK